jgi:hypothetical protein
MPVNDANAVIVAYDVDYMPSRTGPSGRVWFVGSFDYQKS